MITTLTLIGLTTLIILLVAFVAGKRAFVKSSMENERQANTVVKFKAALVKYANSGGKDQDAHRDLLMQSAAVERALGWDNIVTGVNIGMYRMNGAPMLPIALHEMSKQYSESYSYFNRGGEIAHTIQAVIFRHLGRRVEQAEVLQSEAESVGSCVAEGLGLLAGIPLSILSAFGLLSSSKVDAARSSWLFKLWTFVVSLAAIGGPALAYLADKTVIDTAIRAFLN